MHISTTVSTKTPPTFRTAQVAGMFDLPTADESAKTFSVELPDLSDDWQIGLIVGPSGSGKSTIARAAFGDAIYESPEWPQDQAVIDSFGDVPLRKVVHALTAVGFSSPPAWVRPYQTLSNGEQFRCDLARALLTSGSGSFFAERSPEPPEAAAAKNVPDPLPPVTTQALVVFDEFTSVVDRTVARVGSAAIAKQIRSGRLPVRFVAVTCHYDVADWLAPDWVLDMATGELTRRYLRRPEIDLCIYRTNHHAWARFAPHHYLSGALNKASRCYVATINPRSLQAQNDDTSEDAQTQAANEIPIAFAATLPIYGRNKHWRFHRVVVLPDYQGIGIGGIFLDAIAALHREQNLRINLTTSHPAFIGYCRKSWDWRTVNIRRHGSRSERIGKNVFHHAGHRAVVSFEYEK